MKRIIGILAGLSLFAGAVYAAPTALPGDGVANSVHDMNVVGIAGISADVQGRICAFCHTPHHAMDPNDPAVIAGGFDYLPLWSHNLTTNTTFTAYNSATFDGKNNTGIAADPLIGPSRLCMSCHDGTVAPDQHYGNAGGTKFNAAADDTFGHISVGLNGNFSNDHPIGFIFKDTVDADNAHYDAAQGVRGFKFTGADVTVGGTAVYPANSHGFQMPIASVLYPAADGNLYMTCATCHDVHNKDNATNTGGAAGLNYLVYGDQNGSKLCLACHDK